MPETVPQEDKVTLRKELRRQFMGYIITALSLVAGLAWNDAIKAFIEHIFPIDKNGILLKFVYAIVITIAVVAVGMMLSRVKDKK
ncbi:MAG: DUF5654 family protein [Patescibacteria group bacterium]|jgi:uncharacterized membrane protein YidH (DUF202 family)